jgi:ADP-heptose:LPS heptosyltransferase
MNKKKQRVLIIRCGRLGDTVQSTIVLNPLRHSLKNLEIDWLIKTEVAEIFKFEKDITPIALKHTNIPLFLDIKKLKIVFDSYRNPYDLILNLEVSNKFDYLVKLINAKKKLGRPYQYVPDNRIIHRALHQKKILDLSQLGYPDSIASPVIKCIPKNILKKRINMNVPYIVLSPTSSKLRKMNHRGYRNWPLSEWKKLITMLLNQTSYTIFITGGNDEHSKVDHLCENNQRVINQCGKISLSEYAGLLKYSECVIGIDSATVHVASVVGAEKIIGIYGPTSIKSSKPFEKKINQVKIVSKNLPCSPCYGTNVIEECEDNVCMKNIKAEEVFNTLMMS